jgi:hypothetical protein
MGQLVQIMAELRRISAFLPNVRRVRFIHSFCLLELIANRAEGQRGVGAFNREMELVELVQDGPLIGPFSSFADSVEHHLRTLPMFQFEGFLDD